METLTALEHVGSAKNGMRGGKVWMANANGRDTAATSQRLW